MEMLEDLFRAKFDVLLVVACMLFFSVHQRDPKLAENFAAALLAMLGAKIMRGNGNGSGGGNHGPGNGDPHPLPPGA